MLREGTTHMGAWFWVLAATGLSAWLLCAVWCVRVLWEACRGELRQQQLAQHEREIERMRHGIAGRATRTEQS